MSSLRAETAAGESSPRASGAVVGSFIVRVSRSFSRALRVLKRMVEKGECNRLYAKDEFGAHCHPSTPRQLQVDD
jgi:hypothetical protein